MKKLVAESLHEHNAQSARIVRETIELNERNVFGRAWDALKSAVKKVGKFFVSKFGSMIPANTGIAIQQGLAPEGSMYIGDQSDFEMEPSLQQQTEEFLAHIEENSGAEQLSESESKLVAEALVDLKHFDPEVPNVNVDQLQGFVRRAFKNPESTRALLIWGAPGIGKTEIIKQVIKAKENTRMVVVPLATMTLDDWFMPDFIETAAGKTAVDTPKAWLPVYLPTGDPEKDKKGDEEANWGNGGIIFFDELSRAQPSVLNTCLKLIGERILGVGPGGHSYTLGSKWVIISATNRPDDDPDSDQNWNVALGNRFRQINYIPDFESWEKWAQQEKGGKQNVDQRIIDFLDFERDYFYNLDNDPEKSLFATPRSWEAASQGIQELYDDAKDEGYKITRDMVTHQVGADLGLEAANKLAVFLSLMDDFKPEDIKKILTNGDTAPLVNKKDIAKATALVSLIISHTKGREISPDEFSNFVKYIVRLGSPSLGTRAAKEMMRIHPYIHKELGQIMDPKTGEYKSKYKEALMQLVDAYPGSF